MDTQGQVRDRLGVPDAWLDRRPIQAHGSELSEKARIEPFVAFFVSRMKWKVRGARCGVWGVYRSMDD
jgi:hypothetical protein